MGAVAYLRPIYVYAEETTDTARLENVLIEGKVDDQWVEVERLALDRFVQHYQVELSKETDEIRLTKLEGVEFHLDELKLENATPLEYERKLSQTDHDLLEVMEGDIFVFPHKGRDLIISGRVPLSLDPPETHTYHSNWKEQDLSNLIGSIEDGEELVIPGEHYLVTSDYVYPVSGHPEGNIKVYMAKDDHYLNVFAEVEVDNTFDHGKDFFGVSIAHSTRGRYEVKTTESNEYGKWWFDYSDTDVDYEHMFYLVKVPLSDLKDPDYIEYQFDYYGTASFRAAYLPIQKEIVGGADRLEDFEDEGYFAQEGRDSAVFHLYKKGNPDPVAELFSLPNRVGFEEMGGYLTSYTLLDDLFENSGMDQAVEEKQQKLQDIQDQYYTGYRWDPIYHDEGFEMFYQEMVEDDPNVSLEYSLYQYSKEYRDVIESFIDVNSASYRFKDEFIGSFINGEYTLKEVATRDGYELDEQEYTLHLEYSSNPLSNTNPITFVVEGGPKVITNYAEGTRPEPELESEDESSSEGEETSEPQEEDSDEVSEPSDPEEGLESEDESSSESEESLEPEKEESRPEPLESSEEPVDEESSDLEEAPQESSEDSALESFEDQSDISQPETSTWEELTPNKPADEEMDEIGSEQLEEETFYPELSTPNAPLEEGGMEDPMVEILEEEDTLNNTPLENPVEEEQIIMGELGGEHQSQIIYYGEGDSEEQLLPNTGERSYYIIHFASFIFGFSLIKFTRFRKTL